MATVGAEARFARRRALSSSWRRLFETVNELQLPVASELQFTIRK